MDLNWLQAILYGFAVGFTEIIPVSAQAHEAVLSRLFGVDRQYFLRVFITVGVLAALIFSAAVSSAGFGGRSGCPGFRFGGESARRNRGF